MFPGVGKFGYLGLSSPAGFINGEPMGTGANPPEADECFENNAFVY